MYQYSLLNALMAGVSDSGIKVSKLRTKGNQGLGTFVGMHGELLFVDGVVYQLCAGGSVREAGSDDEIPYAVSSQFVPQSTVTVTLGDKTAIDNVLDEFNSHATNLFMTYRIDGRFKSIKCRTVRGQKYKGQPLSELGKDQFVDTYEDVEGTIVGARSPVSWQGFAVAGEHLHFIDKERSKGGHVLELVSEEVKMGMAVVKNVHVELPGTEDFNEATLTSDDAKIKEAEG